VTSTILGASKLSQLDDNLSAIEFSIPSELRQRLDEVSAIPSIHPYMFYEPFLQGGIQGGVKVQRWHQPTPAPVGESLEEISGAKEVA
jgi:hypothetical protein